MRDFFSLTTNMVFFQCAGCGTDCKKNQVEKHKAQCRRSDVFSCIDCSVEFRGQGYASHTRCMTESQKYEAKNSSIAQGSNMSKGDAKQVGFEMFENWKLFKIYTLSFPDKTEPSKGNVVSLFSCVAFPNSLLIAFNPTRLNLSVQVYILARILILGGF